MLAKTLVSNYNKSYESDKHITPRQHSGGPHVSYNPRREQNIVKVHVYSSWGGKKGVDRELKIRLRMIKTYTGADLEPVDSRRPRKAGRPNEYAKYYRIK